MTYRVLGGLSSTRYRRICFSDLNLVERIIHSAQPLGFEAGEDSNRGSVVTRLVDYCMHQGHKICTFSLNASSIRAMVGGD